MATHSSTTASQPCLRLVLWPTEVFLCTQPTWTPAEALHCAKSQHRCCQRTALLTSPRASSAPSGSVSEHISSTKLCNKFCNSFLTRIFLRGVALRWRAVNSLIWTQAGGWESSGFLQEEGNHFPLCLPVWSVIKKFEPLGEVWHFRNQEIKPYNSGGSVVFFFFLNFNWIWNHPAQLKTFGSYHIHAPVPHACWASEKELRRYNRQL